MTADRPHRVDRRRLLAGGAGALLGAGAGTGATLALRSGSADSQANPAAIEDAPYGRTTVAFHGEHQAGIETPTQAFAAFVAFDLASGTDRDALRRWMRVWTDDAVRLTAGQPALADADPELAAEPASLTITVGIGPRVVTAAGRADDAPPWLRHLPPFTVDALEDRWSGGDVVVQVCGDDPIAISHAVRMLTKDARSFATHRWTQRGFLHAHGAVADGATPRNLMGQLDGTSNSQPGSAEFADLTWVTDGPHWLIGGTSLVLRRIRIELDTWDIVSRRGKEESVGRRLSDGAPLTGRREHDEPDFDAVDENGFSVISSWAHIRRARPEDHHQRIVRRPYNYDVGSGQDDATEVGMLFASYQADVDAQFVPIQRRLDEQDLLNEWTTPIGSAVFAVLPGVVDDHDWFARALLE